LDAEMFCFMVFIHVLAGTMQLTYSKKMKYQSVNKSVTIQKPAAEHFCSAGSA